LACTHLESQRLGETFLELLFTPEVEESTHVDWRQFELDVTMSLSSYLDSHLVDDLENLMGLWEPYPLNSWGRIR